MTARPAVTSWPAALALPGFAPDALPFAARTAAAMLLAYAVAFTAQVQPASTAGVCVAIVAQASTGMSLSKAAYRLAGTVVGCMVALCLLAAFPQDRTILLMAYIVWVSLCAGAATLLRDFRSYGAALSGYTVAIIALGVIDAPDTALISALDRTAAITIGIGATLVVNLLFGGTAALGGLVAGLRAQADAAAALAQDALEGRPLPGTLALTRTAAGVAALQTDANYAATEHPDGRRLRQAARFTLAALLGSLGASRALALASGADASPAVRAHLRDVAAAVRAGTEPPAAPAPATPEEALLLDRAAALLDRQRDAAAGLRALTDGVGWMPAVDLRLHHDAVAAFISTARTAVAVSLSACFCVFAGWPGATLLLIQQSAFVGLLGASPTPLTGVLGFALPLAPAALVVGLVNFLVLPSADGFAAFALAVGPLVFATALLARSATLAPFAPAALLYVVLLLSPANQPSFDLGNFLNTVLQVTLAVLFTFLAFFLVLPVSPKRRLYRVASAINEDFTRARAGRRDGPRDGLGEAAAQSLLYDRLSRALVWIGPSRPSREALLDHMSRVGEAQLALRRTRAALDALAAAEPAARGAALAAQDGLASLDPAELRRAAADLLGASGSAAARRAAAFLAELALLLGLRPRILRYHHLMTG